MEKKAKYAINPKILRKNAKYAEKIKTANCKKKCENAKLRKTQITRKHTNFWRENLNGALKVQKNSLRSEML